MKNVWRYVVAVVLAEAVGFIGALSMGNAVSGWYATLNKPVFNPPSWIFAPVWTLLYALMGVSFVVMYDARGTAEEKHEAEAWFFVQLFLNAIWTPVFFGLHAPGWALLVLFALLLALIGTVLRFARVSKAAAWLLTPYLAWAGFAFVLNFAVWRMN